MVGLYATPFSSKALKTFTWLTYLCYHLYYKFSIYHVWYKLLYKDEMEATKVLKTGPMPTWNNKISLPAHPIFISSLTGGRALPWFHKNQRSSILTLSSHLFSHNLLSLLPLMVMYLPTNLGHSPKAVRKDLLPQETLQSPWHKQNPCTSGHQQLH